jgi:hypothetical protein
VQRLEDREEVGVQRARAFLVRSRRHAIRVLIDRWMLVVFFESFWLVTPPASHRRREGA